MVDEQDLRVAGAQALGGGGHEGGQRVGLDEVRALEQLAQDIRGLPGAVGLGHDAQA